ncbi:DUF5320 domain-containing protein [candidate division KSB1 bacterium]|nr:DUF5320 domain-containing protein [candidate division KSB1 bacterium]
MPNYNGTGPSGDGPMTGRGMGYCILKRDKENSSITRGITGLAGNYYQSGHQQQPKTGMPVHNSSGQTTMRTSHGYFVPPFVNPAGRPIFTPLPGRSGMLTSTGYPLTAWCRGRSRGRGRRRGCFFRY